MAEKLNRDRNNKQSRTVSGSRSENQTSSRRPFSFSRRENPEIREPSLRKRDTQNRRPGIDYPPLEDYAE